MSVSEIDEAQRPTPLRHSDAFLAKHDVMGAPTVALAVFPAWTR